MTTKGHAMTRDESLKRITDIRMHLVDLAVDIAEWRQGEHVGRELNAMQCWLNRIHDELSQEDQ